MRTRSIEGIDLPATVICLGALPFSIRDDEATSFAILDRFVEGGGNFLDTALVYGEWVPTGNGASERVFGRWMQSRGNRDELVIGTKGGHPRIASMDVSRLTTSDLRLDVEQSLTNLKVERIDLYWLHRDDPLQPVETILETLEAEVAAGRIAAYGCSNWSLKRMREAEAAAADMGVSGFVANQLRWTLAESNDAIDRAPKIVEVDADMVEFHSSNQLALATYASLANGYFSKLAAAESSELPTKLADRYGNPQNDAMLTRLERAASDLNTSVTAVQLGAITTQAFPTFAIVGVSSAQQIEEAMPGGAALFETDQARNVLAQLAWPDSSNLA